MSLRDIRDSHQRRTRPALRERIVADPAALLTEYAVMERQISVLLKIVYGRREARA